MGEPRTPNCGHVLSHSEEALTSYLMYNRFWSFASCPRHLVSGKFLARATCEAHNPIPHFHGCRFESAKVSIKDYKEQTLSSGTWDFSSTIPS